MHRITINGEDGLRKPYKEMLNENIVSTTSHQKQSLKVTNRLRINTLSLCTKRGSLLNQAYKGIQGLISEVCRIIYSIIVFFISPNIAVKTIYAIILIPLVILEIWGLFWFLCALDDKCYYDNVGA